MKRKIFLAFVLFGVFAIVALGGTLFLIYTSQTLSVDKLENHNTKLLIYDKDNSIIKDNIDYRHVEFKSLPKHVPNAFVAVEDKNFYKHKGISPQRIGKAAFRNIQAGKAKEGASTISQQLIKNTHLSHEKTMQRKVREAALAHKLEQKYSKDEILEMYLNAVYFGNGIYGLESASQYYFSKPATQLSMKEASALAGMLRSPFNYCPINNFDNFSSRGDLVLRLMREQNHITRDELTSAREQNLLVSEDRKKLDVVSSKSYKQATTMQAAKILNKSGSDIANYGYRIFTYYDNNMQEAIVKTALANDYRVKNLSGEFADCVVMSATNDGEINGLYASTPTLINARRNFASSLKPLLVYAPALELGVVSPSTHVMDEEFSQDGFNPRNHDNTHRGAVSVRDSVIYSHNVPAVKVLNYTRIDRATNIAKRMGMFSNDNSMNVGENENLSLALGNTKDGVTFDELMSGYTTLASGGRNTDPSIIRRIEDRNGRVVWKHHQSNMQVIGEDTAFLMTDILRDTAKIGTAKKLNSLEFPVAAKTGTAERGNGSSTNTDAVCVAYTPTSTLIVWHGNASMKPEQDLAKGITGGGVTSFVARDILKATNKKIKPNNTGDTDLNNNQPNHHTMSHWINNHHRDTDKKSPFDIPTMVEQIEYDLQDAKKGTIRRAHESTPTDAKAKDYFSRRYLPKEVSGNYLKPQSPTLDGKISDTGIPLIWFEALPSQIYEIYKIDGAIEKLQEVIRGHDGEYLYFDKSQSKNGTHEYFVKSKIVTSSEALKNEDQDSKGEKTTVNQKPEPEMVESEKVKIITPTEGNKNSKAVDTKKKDSGKQWFF